MTACTPEGDSLAESEADSLAGLTCSLGSSASPESCSASLQLANATLSLREALHFSMLAEYQACYQREAITINGNYRRINTDDKGLQLELQAKSIEGSNIVDSELVQTLGTVYLDANGRRGRYTDIWALQHMPSYAEKPAPSTSVNCERRQ